jgi:hypothetical protein
LNMSKNHHDCWGKWESKGISSWKVNVVQWFNGLRGWCFT